MERCIVTERKGSLQDEADIESTEHLLSRHQVEQRSGRTRIRHLVIPLSLLTLSLIFFAISLIRIRSVSCLPDTTRPFVSGELFDDSLRRIRLEPSEIQGEFFLKSEFKGTPRKSLDDAWQNIEEGGVFGISESSIRRANKSSSGLAEFSPQQGGGYMVSLNVFHQLHCLNIIRKSTQPEFYRNDPLYTYGSSQDARDHIDHCIDIIRQFIMCTGDLTPITYTWQAGRKDPMPNFSMWKVCRNFEDIKKWIKDQSSN